MASSTGSTDGFVQSFLSHIHKYAYDKAKELVDKERELCKANAAVPTIWPQILNALGLLAVAEKSYSSFLYLSLKWFGRKDAKSAYDGAAAECKKIKELESKAGPDWSMIAHICGQLATYANAKSEMIEFFENLHTMTNVKFCDRNDLLIRVTSVIEKNSKEFHHPHLQCLKSTFTLECEILQYLLHAEVFMSKWEFLDSLLCMQKAHDRLSQVFNSFNANTKEVWRLKFSGIKTPSVPVLYTWLKHYKDAIYSKFTLYFYDVLIKQAPNGDMKPFITKCSVDYYSKIVTFHKKTDAFLVSLILYVETGEVMFHGPGYHLPSSEPRSLTGTQMYQPIFCYPQDTLENGQLPDIHRASVVMIVCSMSDKPVSEYDKKTNSTYFVVSIESRVSLVVIYGNKKSEREKKVITTFIQDMSSQLRYAKLFADLRPS